MPIAEPLIGSFLGMGSGWIGSYVASASLNNDKNDDIENLRKLNTQGLSLLLIETPLEIDLITNKSSYQLKAGNRDKKSENPGGYYDGTFIPDYLFVQNHGTLDRCNGRKIKTPEFPNGTYAYFITSEYPSIPRCFKGKPSNDFLKSKR